MSRIIQFFHPGAEHDELSGISWNSGSHKRKFMISEGKCIDSNKKIHYKPLYFWGEWEAQSRILTDYGKSQSHLPRYLFEPFYSTNDISNIGECNTDPFVFGDSFHYCICKQPHFVTLRNLEERDIILFGSHKEGDFVLDTLFVVKNCIPYSRSNFQNLRTLVNATYFDLSIAPIFNLKPVECLEIEEDNDGSIKLKDKEIEEGDCSLYSPTKEEMNFMHYEAVMFCDRYKFNGMYSFVPCSIDGRFARPKIKLDGIVNPEQKQGLKISRNQDAVSIWNNIVNQIFDSGLFLMVENEIPQKK